MASDSWVAGAVIVPRRSRIANARRLITEQPLGMLGLAIFLLLVFLALFAPVIAREDPLAQDASTRFAAPSTEYWLGTDNFGRDVFSRIVYGARISLLVGVSTVALGTTVGAFIGIVCAYFKRVDLILQRVIDTMLVVPDLILALTVIAVLGTSTTNTIIAIALGFIPGASRILRSQALGVSVRPYVEAARSIGASDFRIMMRHIAPNCFAPYIILASSAMASAILAEASLSFLGLGTPAPEPSWGQMLSGSVQQYATRAPWLVIFPGVAITLVVLGFNLFGDALRDMLDPRLRGSR